MMSVFQFSAFDHDCMRQALDLARRAEACGEVPVGAVLALEQTIIAEGYNQPIFEHDPTAHAEIIALRLASERLQNYRLINTTLYCTLEPCCMCAGAIVHARVSRIVFAASDPKGGAGGSVFNLLSAPQLNHRVKIEYGLYARESGELLKAFFRHRRKENTSKIF